MDITFWLVAAAAVLVAGLSKSGLLGGLGLASVPLLSLVMPARDAAGLMLPLLLVMDAISIWNYRREANWGLLKILLPGAAIGTIIGWLMWSVVSDAMVNLMVGVITQANQKKLTVYLKEGETISIEGDGLKLGRNLLSDKAPPASRLRRRWGSELIAAIPSSHDCPAPRP